MKILYSWELTSRYPMHFVLDEKVYHGYDGQKEAGKHVSASVQELDEI